MHTLMPRALRRLRRSGAATLVTVAAASLLGSAPATRACRRGRVP
ncbi:hypothetical protein ACWDRX_35100 [Streptomyces nigra]